MLCVNAGSSTFKFALLRPPNFDTLIKGKMTGVGSNEAKVTGTLFEKHFSKQEKIESPEVNSFLKIILCVSLSYF